MDFIHAVDLLISISFYCDLLTYLILFLIAAGDILTFLWTFVYIIIVSFSRFFSIKDFNNNYKIIKLK